MGALDAYIDISQLGPRATIVGSDIIHIRSTGGIDSKMTITSLFGAIPVPVEVVGTGLNLLTVRRDTNALEAQVAMSYVMANGSAIPFVYARTNGKIITNSTGVEDGAFQIYTALAGAFEEAASFSGLGTRIFSSTGIGADIVSIDEILNLQGETGQTFARIHDSRSSTGDLAGIKLGTTPGGQTENMKTMLAHQETGGFGVGDFVIAVNNTNDNSEVTIADAIVRISGLSIDLLKSVTVTGTIDTGYGPNNVVPEDVYFDKVDTLGSTALATLSVKETGHQAFAASGGNLTISLPGTGTYSYTVIRIGGSLEQTFSVPSAASNTVIMILPNGESALVSYRRIS